MNSRLKSSGTSVLALLISASMLVLPGSAAWAANATLSGTNSASYTEGASVIAPFSSVTLGGGPFDGSYVDFEVVDASGNSITGGSDTDALDDLTIAASGTAVTTSGVVSVVGRTLYLGNGATADPLGEIDATFDGENGTKLRVNFSTTFENSGFESGVVSPWTVMDSRVDMGSTQILGYTTPADNTINYPSACTGNGANDNDAPSRATYSHQITTSEKNSGSYALRLLSSSMTTAIGGDVVHGPAAYSVEFEGTAGQSLSFYWKAANGGDNFHIWGGLLATDPSLPGGASRWTELLDPGSGSVTNWAQTSGTIPHTGKFRFVFISGTHDLSCGNAAGASLYIDDVTITGSAASAAVVQQIAPMVRYASTDDSPPATRYVKMTAVPSSGTSASTTASITVTPVNDAPSIDGDGSTTTVARTVVEQDADSVDSPIANVTGTLVGYDPDGDNPTYSFGVSGGTASGSTVSKTGTYGTLTVNTSTGAYTYVPDMAAIKPLNTGADPVDSFSLTVSDGLLSGSGTLAFTIDSITDTEPSAPTVTRVIGGDGFLTVLFSPPDPLPANSITNYQYSINGGAFRALSPSVTAGAIQISTLSSDGSTALGNGTTYSVRLKAVNTGGTSEASNSVSGSPTNTPAITTPSIQSFEPSASLTAISNDFQVSGFGPTDNLLVTIGLTGHGSGTSFALPNYTSSGVSLGSGYSSYTNGASVTDLAITGTQSKVNQALRGLQLATGTARSNFSVNVSASVVSGSIVQSGSTQSFYEYVAATSPRLTWDQARAEAETKTFAGVSGYLVTITSAEENAFVASRIPGASNVWIGASDATTEGDWRWVTGPEGANGGTRFWYSTSGVVAGQNITTSYSPPSQSRACTATGSSPVGSVDANLVTYACWAANEPNNADGSRGGEDAFVTNWNSSAGMWNDLSGNNSSSVAGYVVEYSEWNGQTFSPTSVVRTSSSVSMGGPVLSASAGAQSAALSWTTPTRSGQTVSSYSVSSVPSVSGVSVCSGTATSCTVSGLTVGTSYTFTVTATWSDSATSSSNSASITATSTPAPASSGGSSGPVVVTPPAVVAPPRVLPRVLPTPPPVVGPVVSGTTSTPPSAPTALVGGRPLAIQTQVTDPNTMSLRAGVLNIGMNVASDQGSVRQQGGSTEIQVRNGGVASVSGSGVLPRSTVQVFMPLGGSNSREIARIPVDATGSFSGDALFGSTPTEAPLPIGRHVLQMVTVDENRQQTVVELTVNIAQPPPAPELNRSTNERPTLLPGQSIATNAGQPEAVTVTPLPDQKQATIEGDGWTMAVGVEAENGGVASGEGGAVVTFVRDQGAVVSGTGFMPGTRADVWLFSDPTLLGTVEIDENGEFNGVVNIDGNVVTVGEHTLQLQGVGQDGFVRAANLGVSVMDEAPALTAESSVSFFWLWLVLILLVVALLVFALLRYRRSRA